MTIQELHSLFLKHPTVCTDTRKITKGSIFFALKGENFNGNKFAAQALEQGCAYAVIDESEFKHNEKTILVNNALACLQELATFHRHYWGKKIIALTGSNGKTTTKELIYAVLRQKYNCLATAGNLNNHIGVPLTLLSLKPHHELAIVEMGANHQGEIAQLCRIAKPDMGLITNIGKAHLEGFGGEEGVLKGKSEMYDYLRLTNGIVFINEGDEKLKSVSAGLQTFSYGFTPDANIKGEILSGNVFLEMKIENKSESVHVQTKLTGNYNAINILCAAAVGVANGLSIIQVKTGIEEYEPDNSRSQVVKTNYNTLIMDAYNANPSSMMLALENLARINAPQKMFVLGDMREMGDYAQAEHLAVLKKIKELKLKGVLVGEEFSRYKNEFDFTFFENAEQALNWLKQKKVKENLVLIKGSRGIKLEQVVPAF